MKKNNLGYRILGCLAIVAGMAVVVLSFASIIWLVMPPTTYLSTPVPSMVCLIFGLAMAILGTSSLDKANGIDKSK